MYAANDLVSAIRDQRLLGMVWHNISIVHDFSEIIHEIQVERAESVWYLNYQESGSDVQATDILVLLTEQQKLTDAVLEKVTTWPDYVDLNYPDRER